MKRTFTLAIVVLAATGLTACSKSPEPAPTAATAKVDASGKQPVALDAIPPEVISAAMAVRPGMQIGEAEHETRNGADYYDVEGTLNGAEIELDLTRVDGVWKVVEVQRDIGDADVPAIVMTALKGANPQFSPTRIIESDQGDGIVIYEFFRPRRQGGAQTKIEVKTESGAAEVLTSEWVH